jgi:hypothetical protein
MLDPLSSAKTKKKRRYLPMWSPLRGSEGQSHTLFPDLPPEILLVQFLGRNIFADNDELLRARWFWQRQPNKLILSPQKILRVVPLCLLLWMASLFVRDQVEATNVVGIIAWVALAAIAVAVFVDIIRYAQWKWEYTRAIARLFATAIR